MLGNELRCVKHVVREAGELLSEFRLRNAQPGSTKPPKKRSGFETHLRHLFFFPRPTLNTFFNSSYRDLLNHDIIQPSEYTAVRVHLLCGGLSKMKGDNLLRSMIDMCGTSRIYVEAIDYY